MRIKIIVFILLLIGIMFTAFFGFGLKDIALKGMVEDISEYNCGAENLCTSCIIDGHLCNCGELVCSCGNKTVDKKECELYD